MADRSKVELSWIVYFTVSCGHMWLFMICTPAFFKNYQVSRFFLGTDMTGQLLEIPMSRWPSVLTGQSSREDPSNPDRRRERIYFSINKFKQMLSLSLSLCPPSRWLHLKQVWQDIVKGDGGSPNHMLVYDIALSAVSNVGIVYAFYLLKLCCPSLMDKCRLPFEISNSLQSYGLNTQKIKNVIVGPSTSNLHIVYHKLSKLCWKFMPSYFLIHWRVAMLRSGPQKPNMSKCDLDLRDWCQI